MRHTIASLGFGNEKEEEGENQGTPREGELGWKAKLKEEKGRPEEVGEQGMGEFEVDGGKIPSSPPPPPLSAPCTFTGNCKAGNWGDQWQWRRTGIYIWRASFFIFIF